MKHTAWVLSGSYSFSGMDLQKIEFDLLLFPFTWVLLSIDQKCGFKDGWKNWWSIILDQLCVFPFYSFGNPIGLSENDFCSRPWCEGVMGYFFLIYLWRLKYTVCESFDYSYFLIYQDTEGSVLPPPIPLSSEHISNEGVYFLENGEDGLLFVGESVDSDILQKLFAVSSAAEIPNQVINISLH